MQHAWLTAKPYAWALFIFLTSRIVMLSGIFFAVKFIPTEPNHLDVWNADGAWYRYLLRFDAGWYYGLANAGYHYNGDDTVPQGPVFYPLYPLITRLVSWTGIPLPASLLLISAVAILIAVPLLFKLIRESHDETVAFYAIAFLSFFPTSMFLSAGYTESLTLLLVVVFFVLLRKRYFFLAAITAGLASGTRSTGFLLILPLIIELWRQQFSTWRKFIFYLLSTSIIATAGLWLFILYLWWSFDSPFAFVTNVHAWEMGGPSNSIVSALLLKPFYEHLGEIRNGPLPNNLDPWIFLIFVVLLVSFRRKLSPPLWVYSLGVLLLPYFSRAGGILGFLSMMRYMLLAFPVFVIIGGLCKNRLWLGLSIIGLLAGFLFMYSGLFAQWYWVG